VLDSKFSYRNKNEDLLKVTGIVTCATHKTCYSISKTVRDSDIVTMDN